MTSDLPTVLPVAIVGAGPVGLAAAAHAVERGLTPLLLERGRAVGAALSDWGHVRVFSPWRYNIDRAARALLETTGWSAPDLEALPTGAEIVARYLKPLAAHPEIAPHLRLGAEVVGVTREGFDKTSSSGRAAAPFLIRWRTSDGTETAARAHAVIDASGTWFSPNPMGVDGLPVLGEADAAQAGDLAYGIPDVLGADRAVYADRRVLVVGGGHSAINAVLDLLDLRAGARETQVFWALRHDRIDKLLGGGLNDQLPERGALGFAAKTAIDDGRLTLLAPFAAERIERRAEGLRIAARTGGQPVTVEVDRVVVATGFRPDLRLQRELRVALDPVVEAPPALAPLIDPNLHSCGTVPPHGAAELAHPEPGFFIAGAKSYGRAPTFLMATGYEQVRSIVAAIAGDHEAARQVRLVLPETGVCSGAPAAADEAVAACCGGPAPAEVDACCLQDADAKAEGEAGCGCGPETPQRAVPIPTAATASSCCNRPA